jgi:hypothetical protein
MFKSSATQNYNVNGSVGYITAGGNYNLLMAIHEPGDATTVPASAAGHYYYQQASGGALDAISGSGTPAGLPDLTNHPLKIAYDGPFNANYGVAACSPSTPHNFLNGRIAEILIYERTTGQRTLTASERNVLRRYFAAKWGLTLTME